MQIVIHIGLHKTGTTFLQKKVFPSLFKEDYFLCKKYAERAFRHKLFHPEKINFFSEENWSNSIREPQKGWDVFCDFVDQLSCLNNAEVKIILVLRKHIDWLWSAYLHELKMNRKKSISFEEYARSYGEKGLSWSERIDYLSEFKVMVIDYKDLLDNPALSIQRVASFAGVDSLCPPLLYKSTRQNLTPRTEPTIVACQNFEKTYQLINNSVRHVTGRSLPTESARETLRDLVIFLVSKVTPNAKRIERPELPKELQDRFDEDWRAAWAKIVSKENNETQGNKHFIRDKSRKT